MTIIDGMVDKIEYSSYHSGMRVIITNIENLRTIIRRHLEEYSPQEIGKADYNLWKSLLTNDKECHATVAVSVSGNFRSLLRTKRKDILDEWTQRGEAVFDYDIPGAVPIKKKPKRKLEL